MQHNVQRETRKDVGAAKNFGLSPESKAKPRYFITSYPHSFIISMERSFAIGKLWKQIVSGGTFSQSVVVLATHQVFHIS